MRTRKPAGVWIAAVITFVLGTSTPSGALQKILSVVDQATIVDVSGESRVLVRFDPFDDLRDECGSVRQRSMFR